MTTKTAVSLVITTDTETTDSALVLHNLPNLCIKCISQTKRRRFPTGDDNPSLTMGTLTHSRITTAITAALPFFSQLRFTDGLSWGVHVHSNGGAWLL